MIILMGPVARLILDGYGYGPFTAPSRTTILQIGIAASCLAALLVISLVSRRFYPVPFSSLSLITFFAVLFGFVDLIGDEIAARMVELVDIAMLAMLIALDLRSMRANSPPPLAERVDDP
ncbi:MAG: hypothetical protein JSR96_02770 [Proteobacteria bacterium]|nr:hypothetical protein [Pseudomonadota bacterium]